MIPAVYISIQPTLLNKKYTTTLLIIILKSAIPIWIKSKRKTRLKSTKVFLRIIQSSVHFLMILFPICQESLDRHPNSRLTSKKEDRVVDQSLATDQFSEV